MPPSLPALVDLHVHTRASDGRHAPEEVVNLAVERGLSAIAITDHDTVAGIGPAVEAGRAAGLPVVAGVELACDIPHNGVPCEAHVLGLFITPETGAPEFSMMARRREERMKRMLARMDALGLPPVTLPEIQGAPGRPHLARALVERGLVKSVNEAFSRYLRDGGPLDEPKTLLPLEEGVALIHRMGGLALLAHPCLSWAGQVNLETWLENEWPEGAAQGPCGLDGVEAYHSRHSGEQVARLLRWAARRDAAVCGGSDFHGMGEGAALGTPAVPMDVYGALAERAKKS